MNTEIWGNRWLHSLVLGLFGVAIVLTYRDTLGVGPVFVMAVGPIFAWLLGRFHERAVVIEAGLADEDELRDARRESEAESSLFGWGRG